MSSILDLLPDSWRTDVTVTGPSQRTADGMRAPADPPVAVAGVVVVPSSAAPPADGSLAPPEGSEDTAMLYAAPGAQIRHRDVVTVPAPHPLAGSWLVDRSPSHWPLGVAITMTRRHQEV
ncbi:hypothetical protein [Actinomyces succiniciruminis]|uniref:Uncharacterized protein n=1 Tax=Actinomyces succiniciruminis TaxID=1522002 RepID=A0A1L7RMC1_9ACTO|nr:hypothetical protein [Actinomyces succiniciruminis]CED90618.1 Hypothetical protein AAM4_0786 [Actinomyces succiniciruminis]